MAVADTDDVILRIIDATKSGGVEHEVWLRGKIEGNALENSQEECRENCLRGVRGNSKEFPGESTWGLPEEFPGG